MENLFIIIVLGTCTIISGPGGNSASFFIHIFGPGFPYFVITFCYIMIIWKLKQSRHTVQHHQPAVLRSPQPQRLSEYVMEARITNSSKQVNSIKKKIRHKNIQEPGRGDFPPLFDNTLKAKAYLFSCFQPPPPPATCKLVCLEQKYISQGSSKANTS